MIIHGSSQIRALLQGTPPSEIHGQGVLDKVYDFIGRFVAYPSEHARVAHTLWIAHAHLMDAWENTPRLAFLSAEPASGESRGLEITELLVPRPVLSVNATPAYLFRKVSDPQGAPTVLYDEIDTVFGDKAKDNEELRGLINAGHRKGAKAGRCVHKGTEIVTEDFPAYCAVAMAGLGNLPDTILTRSVVIRMRKRKQDEVVEAYRRRQHEPEGSALRAQLAEWTERVKAEIGQKWPEMPEGVQDRDADVWESLLAVADAAGGDWPKKARSAAVTLVLLNRRDGGGSLGVRLLTDLRNVFGSDDRLFTADILDKLLELEEAPWNSIKGDQISDRLLANLLKQYGVESKQIRIGGTNKKGYERKDLQDAWERYLPPLSGSLVSDVSLVSLFPGEGGECPAVVLPSAPDIPAKEPSVTAPTLSPLSPPSPRRETRETKALAPDLNRDVVEWLKSQH